MKRLMIATLLCTSLHTGIAWSASDTAPMSLYSADDRNLSSDPEVLAVMGKRPITGTQNVLLVVGHWSGQPGLIPDKVREQTFSTHWDSLRSYILAASGNKLKLEGTQIEADFGPAPEKCSASGSLAAGRAAALEQNIDPAAYQYLFVAVPCGGGAVATVPGNWLWVKGQPGSPHVWKHEFGHNLGYHHGSTYSRCPVANNVIQAPEHCTVIAYGDTGDSVSGGGTLYPASNRWFSGWLDDSQAAVIKHTGLYRLGVLGQEGPQLYLINRPTAPNQIALEYRQPTPFDNFSPDDNRVTGVWIRYTSMNGSVHNVQLDATPETLISTDPTLQPGHVLEDATAKVKVAVCTADKSGATLAVALNGARLPYCTTTVPAPALKAPASYAKTGLKPVIAGTSWPGARILVTSNETPAQPLGETVADAQGKWSLQPAKNLDLGTHGVKAQQIFGPKTSVATPERIFDVVDIEVSPATIDNPVKGVQTGLQPTVEGSGIPGATVRLLEHNKPYTTLATTVVNGFGRYSVRIDGPLPERIFRLTGYQSIDGKKSGWIADHPIQVIGLPASAKILTPEKNTTTSVRPVITGTGVAEAIVVLLEHNQPNKPLATTVVKGDGTFSVQIENPLPERTFRLTGYQVINGKKSGWITDHPIKVDSTIPTP